MELLHEYTNGNYVTRIYDDGTKVRETDDDDFLPSFSENIDVKITDYCDMGCPMCHETSTVVGLHGDIMHPFVDSLHPGTEIAVGGGNPLAHPELPEFLLRLVNRGVLPNLTVHQTHFMTNQGYIKELVDEKLVYGVGVSLAVPTDDFIETVQRYPNAVVHVINGYHPLSMIKRLGYKDLKILILGYKYFGRGVDHYNVKIAERKWEYYEAIKWFFDWFKIVSFDNLAIEQLNIREFLTDKEWEQFYMGDDGNFTFYIDLVEEEFAKNSTSDTRYKLMDDVRDMFAFISTQT